MQDERTGRLVIDTAGHEIAYRIVGDAPETLLVVHGGPGVSHRYLDRLSELASPERKVCFYDQLGSGESDWPEPDEPDLWTIPRFVDELESVRSQLDLGAVHLLGQSWGGNLALQYTLEHPHNVQTLTLANTAASAPDIVRGMAALKVELGRELGSNVLARALRHEVSGKFDHPEYQEWVMNLYCRYLRRSTPFDPKRSREEFIAIAKPFMDEVGPAYLGMWGPNEFVCTGAEIDFDVNDRLEEISAPTLVVCGYYDELVIELSRTMADRIPDTEFVIFGNSSHLTILEKEANLYLAVIKNFLTRHATQDPSPITDGATHGST